jgi:hypothetical protein
LKQVVGHLAKQRQRISSFWHSSMAQIPGGGDRLTTSSLKNENAFRFHGHLSSEKVRPESRWSFMDGMDAGIPVKLL